VDRDDDEALCPIVGNESLPPPVIDLPKPSGDTASEPQAELYQAGGEGIPLKRVDEPVSRYGVSGVR
jgi:hypothetical protein